MAAGISIFSYLPSIRTVVRTCLWSQIVVAGLLTTEHLWSDYQFGGERPIRPVETREITPGDQSRPFQRVGVPAHKDRTLQVNSPVSLPYDLPPRLEFSMHEDDAFGRVLLVTGGIEGGDAKRFEAFLDTLDQLPDLIALHSPGGRVAEALAIGETIREREMTTFVGPDAACASSCPYVFAGGQKRIASRASWIGLHQHYYDEKSFLPMFIAVQGIQTGQGETMAYLDEMGIDPLILVHALKTPPEDIYFLVEAELMDYRLATEIID